METDYWSAIDYQSQLKAVNPRAIGISTSITKKGLDQLKTRVFEGASNVELGFLGKEKGNLGQGGTTPEMHSKEEREEMRQMAKINEVDLTTHATVAVGGLAGFGERGFTPEQKEKAVHEIQRTVDFAADVAQGGPVVVHTGEFPRPISKAEEKFEAYPREKERRIHYLVDEVTGDLIKTVKEDEAIFEPKPMEEGGKIIYQKKPDGTPRIDPITKEPIPEPKLDEYGNIVVEPLTFKEFKKDLEERKGREWADKNAPKLFFDKQQRAEMEHQAGQAEQYEMAYKEGIKRKLKLEELQKAFETAKTLEGKQAIIEKAAQSAHRAPDPHEDMDKFFKDSIRDAEKTATYGREIALGARRQAEQRALIIKRAQPMEEYGVKESADALARSGIYAYDKEKTMKLKKPLFVAPENVFPETYGSHPQELKNLIIKSRENMAKKLHDERGITTTQAKKIADDHIKATFDVGHANTWKKFFKREEGETPEQTDKRFKKWMTNQVEDLQKKGIIGHVHISDNFGYYDEHLAPGEGNVPLKELAEKLQKHGYKGKYITEWGAQPEAQSFRVMTGAWRTLASPIYKVDTAGLAWSDIEGSYFGRTGSPGYLVGDIAPSKDWSLWSEVQLE